MNHNGRRIDIDYGGSTARTTSNQREDQADQQEQDPEYCSSTLSNSGSSDIIPLHAHQQVPRPIPELPSHDSLSSSTTSTSKIPTSTTTATTTTDSGVCPHKSLSSSSSSITTTPINSRKNLKQSITTSQFTDITSSSHSNSTMSNQTMMDTCPICYDTYNVVEKIPDGHDDDDDDLDPVIIRVGSYGNDNGRNGVVSDHNNHNDDKTTKKCNHGVCTDCLTSHILFAVSEHRLPICCPCTAEDAALLVSSYESSPPPAPQCSTKLSVGLIRQLLDTYDENQKKIDDDDDKDDDEDNIINNKDMSNVASKETTTVVSTTTTTVPTTTTTTSQRSKFDRLHLLATDKSLVECTRCSTLNRHGPTTTTTTTTTGSSTLSSENVDCDNFDNFDPNLIQCHECGHGFCFVHGDGHLGRTCKEYTMSGEESTDEYFKDHQSTIKPCSRCKAYIHKDSGCDHMVCTNCKEDFCWQCGTHIYLTGEGAVRTCRKCKATYLDHRKMSGLCFFMTILLFYFVPALLYVALALAVVIATLCCCCCFCCGIKDNSVDDDDDDWNADKMSKEWRKHNRQTSSNDQKSETANNNVDENHSTDNSNDHNKDQKGDEANIESVQDQQRQDGTPPQNATADEGEHPNENAKKDTNGKDDKNVEFRPLLGIRTVFEIILLPVTLILHIVGYNYLDDESRHEDFAWGGNRRNNRHRRRRRHVDLKDQRTKRRRQDLSATETKLNAVSTVDENEEEEHNQD